MTDWPPWDYRSKTHKAIKDGRPITADEGLALLAEIHRLRQIARLAADLFHTSSETDRILGKLGEILEDGAV